jgi:hypothetical protein
MAAALFRDKETGDLALHVRCHEDRAWLCQRLDSRRSVWRIAVNFAPRIDDHWTGFDTDACV